jgi:hypothetical protein
MPDRSGHSLVNSSNFSFIDNAYSLFVVRDTAVQTPLYCNWLHSKNEEITLCHYNRRAETANYHRTVPLQIAVWGGVTTPATPYKILGSSRILQTTWPLHYVVPLLSSRVDADLRLFVIEIWFFGSFMKVCQKISNFDTNGQKYWPLYMKKGVCFILLTAMYKRQRCRQRTAVLPWQKFRDLS